jgi:hypothetical protein
VVPVDVASGTVGTPMIAAAAMNLDNKGSLAVAGEPLFVVLRMARWSGWD